MRTWSLLVLLSACGPIYPDPPTPTPPPPPPGEQSQWSSAPPSGPRSDPAEPANPYREAPPSTPDDPYVSPDPGERSRDDRRPSRGGTGGELGNNPYAAPPIGPAPPDPSAAPPSGPRLPANAQALLDAHNRVRAKHCAAPLRWSAQLAQYAQKWANSLRADGCKFGHSGGGYGENLAAGTAGTLDAQSVTDMWYREIDKYSFARGAFSMDTGHFTQVVWRGSTQLGCAVTTCRNLDIWVCEYDPPGNVQGDFRKNVLPTNCR